VVPVNDLAEEDQSMNRCPATTTVTIDEEPLELRCVHWSDDPNGRHQGEHLVHTSPAMGDDPTWTNDDPLNAE
jgi:hypothetical protein